MKRILIAVIAVTSLIFGALIFLNLCGYTPQLALVPKSDSDVTYYIPPQLPTPPPETPPPSVPEDIAQKNKGSFAFIFCIYIPQ